VEGDDSDKRAQAVSEGKEREGRASWAAGLGRFGVGWLGFFLLLLISFLFYFKPNSNQIEFK
jgi:hypothetical protein